MKRLALLALVLALPSTAAADGCPPSDCGTATVAVPGSPTLAVRPNGGSGPALVYDLASGRHAFSLRPGLLSADGRVHFVSRVTAKGTTLERYDARTGRRVASWTLAGRWWANAVSAGGERLVFKRIAKGRTSRLAVVSGVTGRVLHEVRLRGNLEAEALARDGRRLFLVQWLRRGYAVRAYDVTSRRLRTIRAGLDPAVMRGIAWGAVASADGRWLLTLYIEPDGETAIHALDTLRGRAACIDLPSAGFQQNQQYALAVRGTTAVAANPALGVAARVDLLRDAVSSVSRFRAVPELTPYGNPAALDGRRAVFASGARLWSYDVRTGRVDGPVKARGRVIGLAFARDGRLRLVRIGGAMSTLEI